MLVGGIILACWVTAGFKHVPCRQSSKMLVGVIFEHLSDYWNRTLITVVGSRYIHNRIYLQPDVEQLLLMNYYVEKFETNIDIFLRFSRIKSTLFWWKILQNLTLITSCCFWKIVYSSPNIVLFELNFTSFFATKLIFNVMASFSRFNTIFATSSNFTLLTCVQT